MASRPSFFRTYMFRRLLGIFVPLVFMPVILIAFASYSFRYQQITDVTSVYLQDIATMRARQIDILNLDNVNSLRLIAHWVEVDGISRTIDPSDQQISDMRKRLEEMPVLYTAILRRPGQADIQLGRNPMPEIARAVQSQFRANDQSHTPYIERSFITADGRNFLESRLPLVKDGQEIGHIGFVWNIGPLAASLQDGLTMFQSAQITVWLPQDDGSMRNLWQADMAPEAFGARVAAGRHHPVVQAFNKVELNARFVDDDGVKKFAGAVLTNSGWVVLTTVHEDEIIGNLMGLFVAIFAGGLGLLMFALWALVRTYGQQFLTLNSLLVDMVDTTGLDIDVRQDQADLHNRTGADELSVAIASVGLMIERLQERNLDLESELRRRSLALANAQAELTEVGSNERVLQMTSMLSHEINQPLGNISILIEDWLADKDDIAAVEGLEEDLIAINAMVQQIRAISKNVRGLGARNAVLQVGPISIRDVLDQAQKLAIPMLTKHEVSMAFDASDGLPPIAGNDSALQQVFSNLIQNACLAMGENRERSVVIRAYRPAGSTNDMAIDIVDTGSGIPEELGGQIFKPGISSRLENGGSGLGLAVVRRIVEALGGNIKVVETGSGGTTIRLTLPIWHTSPGSGA